jgi:acyl-CoA synthetase (NDP forming)
MNDSIHELDYIFHPRSVAIVGASTQVAGKLSLLLSFKGIGFDGDLYPVNPKAEQILDYKCYPRLRDIPGEVEYVISEVPTSAVGELVEDAGLKGVKVIHFFTAGFSETGEEERIELEAQVLARARELGIRVIGPNCMGLYVPSSKLAFNPDVPKEPGPVALISQSGANAGEFIRMGALRGLRYSKVISYGNAADLSEADFLDYCAWDPETKIIAAYIEGVKDGQRFMRSLRRASAVKPVVILKGGRTEAGGRATDSHTGSLAGSREVFDTACRQGGAIQVDDLEDLIDMAVAFRFVGSLRGPQVGIVGGGGGRSVLAADSVSSTGLSVPALPEDTQRRLREFTPVAGTSVRNPIDAGMGWGRREAMERMLMTLRIVAEAPNIDLVLFHTHFGWGFMARNFRDLVKQAQDIVEAVSTVAREVGTPIAGVTGPAMNAPALEAIQAFQAKAGSLGLATFPGVKAAANAFSRLLTWQRMREEGTFSVK